MDLTAEIDMIVTFEDLAEAKARLSDLIDDLRDLETLAPNGPAYREAWLLSYRLRGQIHRFEMYRYYGVGNNPERAPYNQPATGSLYRSHVRNRKFAHLAKANETGDVE